MIPIAAIFLRLGLTSFGGPTAHLGYFHEEFVVRRKWVSERQYAELVALCQFLPGPASSQVGFALGLIRGGLPGAVTAWLGFTLPSALLLGMFAFGVSADADAWWAPAVTGLNAVVVGVVAHAVWGMARTLTPDVRRALIGAAGLALAILVPGVLGQIGAICLGAAAGLAWCRAVAERESLSTRGEDRSEFFSRRLSRRVAVTALALFVVLLVALPVLARFIPSTMTAAADALYRAGAFVFGGGHVMLPLLQAEPAIAQAVTSEEFLAGYGAAQAVPGPLFTFAAYLGALMGDDAGGASLAMLTAAIALVAIFLPGMLLLLGVLPYWDRLRRYTMVRAAVLGASAAVVGILGAALVDPVFGSGVSDAWTLVLALGCFVLLAVWKVPAWLVVLLGAGVGFLLPHLPGL